MNPAGDITGGCGRSKGAHPIESQHLHLKNAKEMLAGSQEVKEQTANMNTVSMEIIDEMGDIADGAEQITVPVHTVNDLSIKNKDRIESLIKEAAKFNVN